MVITEELLEKLGFEKNLIDEEQAGGPAYYYYSLDLLKDEDDEYAAICLLTCAHDEVDADGGWVVELLDNGHHKIKNAELLENFVSACRAIENQ